MTYYFFDTPSGPAGETVRNIIYSNGNGYTTFPDVETNDGPERTAYLAWVADGNTPEPWNPEL